MNAPNTFSAAGSPFDAPLEVRPLNEPRGIEPELLKPAPRWVRYRGGNAVWWALGFLSALILAGVFVLRGYHLHNWWVVWVDAGGVAFLWIGFWRTALQQRVLVARGVPIRARIVRKGTNKTNNNVPTFWLEYVFSPAEGAVAVSKRCPVSRSLWHEVEEGGELTVLFNAQRPTRNIAYRTAFYRAF